MVLPHFRENAPCIFSNAAYSWCKCALLFEKCKAHFGKSKAHFGKLGALSRLAQLFVDEGELAGCEAERAVAVGHRCKLGRKGGVGLDEALHLLACPHGGVVAKVEVGQFGEGDGFHTGTPPF